MRPKYHRGHPVHSAALGGGGGGRWRVLPHHVHLLSVRKSGPAAAAAAVWAWPNPAPMVISLCVFFNSQAFLTTISLSAIATNGVVPGKRLLSF